jgi:hypothetical protein
MHAGDGENEAGVASCGLFIGPLDPPCAGFLGFNWLYVKWEESHDVKFDQML